MYINGNKNISKLNCFFPTQDLTLLTFNSESLMTWYLLGIIFWAIEAIGDKPILQRIHSKNITALVWLQLLC